jgi:phosphatidylinositol glycan class B
MAFPLAAASARAAPILLATVVIDLLALSFVGHKEFRYVFPFVPTWFALAGVGFSWFLSQRQWLVLPFAAAALVSGLGFHRLTFADIGLYENANPPQSAYDGFGDVNRLLFAAHDQPDLCGLQLIAARMAWTGGSTYLHRDVPIYGRDDAGSAGHFNYVITAGNVQGDLVAHEGRVSLVRVGKDCTPDPSYNWALR